MEIKKETEKYLKTSEEQSILERVSEKILWNTRFIVLLAVLFSILSAISLFVFGSIEIFHAIINDNPLVNDGAGHKEMLYKMISAVDLYLIGIVLLIFGFGIYELFISKIDIAREDLSVTILEIENLDELKNKIIKVIVMVLIVSFFERVLKMSDSYSSSMDMLWFAISIFAISFGVYYLKKHN